MYIRPATAAEAIEAERINSQEHNLKRPEQYYYDTQMALADIRKAYRGGAMARDLLLERKIGETPDQWNNRYRNFQNVRLTREIVAFKSSLLYVAQPERCLYYAAPETSDDPALDAEAYELWKEGSEELDSGFKSIYDYNRASTVFAKQIGPRTFRDGCSWVKVWPETEGVRGEDGAMYDGDVKRIRFASFLRENVRKIVDPDDADTCLGWVELRPRGQGFDRWLWTALEYGPINERWEFIGEGSKPNPVPGFAPFVMFGLDTDDGNELSDAVMDQKHLVNLRSHVAMGIRSQTFPILQITGRVKSGSKFKGPDGIERIYISPEGVLMLDEGGTAQILKPDYPLDPVLAAERQEHKRALESYRVSGFSVDPTSAPEQPMSLAIKMTPSLWARAEDVAMFTDAEMQLARTVAAYAATYDLIPCTVDQIKDESVEVEINFPDNVLPSDKAVERTADQSDVAASNMLREEYYTKHIDTDADAQEVAEAMAKLDQQAATRASMAAQAMPQIPGRMPFGMAPGAASNGNGQSVTAQLLARMGQPRNPAIDYRGGGGTAGTESGSTTTTTGGGSTSGGTGGGRTGKPVPGLG